MVPPRDADAPLAARLAAAPESPARPSMMQAVRCNPPGISSSVWTNGRNTGLSGRSFHSRSSVEVHSSTRPAPTSVRSPAAPACRRRTAPGPARLAAWYGAIAIEARGREVAAARRAEQLEHRVAVFEAAQPRRRRVVRSTGVAGERRARSPAACAGQVACGPAAMSRPPPPRRSAPSRSASSSGTWTSLRTTTGASRDRRPTPSPASRVAQLDARRLADRQRARQVERLAVGAGAVDDDGAHRLGRRDDEVEHVVARQARRRAACTVRAHVARRDGERREGHARRSARGATLAGSDWIALPSTSSVSIDVGDRLGAVVDDDRR